MIARRRAGRLPHLSARRHGRDRRARGGAARCELLRAGRPLAKSSRTLDFLTGLPSQCTMIEPGKRLYAMLERARARARPRCCRSRPASRWPTSPNAAWPCSAWAPTKHACRSRSPRCARPMADAESEFDLELYSPDDAVRRAMQRGAPGSPVVLADTQDNPGAGGNGDTTGLLSSLLRHDAPGRGAGPADRSGLGEARARGRRAPRRRASRWARSPACPATCRSTGSSSSSARRRPLHLHRADVPRLPHGPRPDGAAAARQRARRARVEKVPDRRPGDVPPRGHRAAAAARARAQELGAFPRRLRADRARGPRGRAPGPAKADPTDVRVDAPAPRPAAAAARPGVRAPAP